MDNPFEGLVTPKRMKRADQIVEAVKHWVVAQNLKPGYRLPNEKALTELFDCSNGTVREALKSLEVQGLVTLKTGPKGGAILSQVPFCLTSQLLRNYLHFQSPTGPNIYRLRTLVEPEIASLVVNDLTEKDIQKLEALTERCSQAPKNLDERLAQRIAELDFHNILAKRCKNPLLAFIGRFLNDLIRDLVVYKKVRLPEQVDFSYENYRYHCKLIAAFKEKDVAKVHSLMSEHMASAECFNLELEGQLSQGFLSKVDPISQAFI